MNPTTLKPAELPDDAASLKAMLLSLMAAHEQEKQRGPINSRNRPRTCRRSRMSSTSRIFRLQVPGGSIQTLGTTDPARIALSTALELGQKLLAFGEEFDSKPVNKEDLPAG